MQLQHWARTSVWAFCIGRDRFFRLGVRGGHEHERSPPQESHQPSRDRRGGAIGVSASPRRHASGVRSQVDACLTGLPLRHPRERRATRYREPRDGFPNRERLCRIRARAVDQDDRRTESQTRSQPRCQRFLAMRVGEPHHLRPLRLSLRPTMTSERVGPAKSPSAATPSRA